MRNRLWLYVLIPVAVIAVAAGFLLNSPHHSEAHGNVDQSQESHGGSAQILVAQPVGQSFVPSQDPLVAVDLFIIANANADGDCTVTVNIRQGTISGTILGTTSMLLPQSSGSAWRHFDFPSAISVVTGNTYVIDIASTTASCAIGYDISTNYTSGTAISSGAASPASDLAFRTYSHVPGPDMTITKTNNVSGSVTYPGAWTWTIVVKNIGDEDAVFPSLQLILLDDLPSGIVMSNLDAAFSGDITGAIPCDVQTDTLACFASVDGAVTFGPGGTFTFSFTATPTVGGDITNPRPGGQCTADPDNVIDEADETNNTCSDTVHLAAPDLRITKTNNVSGHVTYPNSWTWTIVVANVGDANASFDNGETIFLDTAPAGVSLSFVGGDFAGPGTGDASCTLEIRCVGANGPTTIGPGGTFTLVLGVTPTATGDIVNPPSSGECTVDPANLNVESDEANNSCSDSVTVTQPDLTVTKANDVGGTTTLGNSWTWTLTVTNGGTGPAEFSTLDLILQDTMPATHVSYGTPTAGSFSGVTNSGNISCSLPPSGPGTQSLACEATGPVTVGAGGSFAVSVVATPSVAETFVNPVVVGECLVDPGDAVGESDEGHNTCLDVVTVTVPTGTITVHKVVDSGSAALTLFCFTLSPDPGNGQVCANGSGDAVFTNVPANTYSANETSSPATYHQVSNDCSGTLTITTQGSTDLCTFHDAINTGTLTVHKVLDAGTSPLTLFCFTLSPDPGNGQVCANGSGDAVFPNVPANTYSANETSSPATYHQVSNDCSATLTITTQGGSDSCTFHDAINTGTITVHKALDSGSDPLTGFCFTLAPDPGNGQICANGSGDAVFPNVPANTYSAIETSSPATYHPVANDCTATLTITTQGSSDLCAFHDAINTGTINVHKTLDSGGDPLTGFCFTLSPDPGNGQVCANGTGDASFTNVPANTYSVTETTSPSSYHEVSNSCTGLAIMAQGTTLSCNIHDALNIVTFHVHKVWQPLDGRQITIHMTCNAGATVTVLDPTAGQFDSADFMIENGTHCTASETTPAGYTSNQTDCLNFVPTKGDCTIINRKGTTFPTFTPAGTPHATASVPATTPVHGAPRPTRTPVPRTHLTSPHGLSRIL